MEGNGIDTAAGRAAHAQFLLAKAGLHGDVRRAQYLAILSSSAAERVAVNH
jgi:hypothetical protein